jgi:hypothetical protein
MMNVLSRAGSSRKVADASRDLIFLWGIMSMMVSPVSICSEMRASKAEAADKEVLGCVYPVFRKGLYREANSMRLIWIGILCLYDEVFRC